MRPIGNFPTTSGDFQEQTVRFRLQRINEVDVIVRSIASGGVVSQRGAAVSPTRPGVTRFAIGEQGDFAVSRVVSVELIEFPAARVLGENNAIAMFRTERAAHDRFLGKSQLFARTSRKLDPMELGSI